MAFFSKNNRSLKKTSTDFTKIIYLVQLIYQKFPIYLIDTLKKDIFDRDFQLLKLVSKSPHFSSHLSDNIALQYVE